MDLIKCMLLNLELHLIAIARHKNIQIKLDSLPSCFLLL
ncbi:hypothetical protein SLEP1_g44488 [Rubroshorea leprosula]|uniref:Uncharacterized protein n=1 Tax=Rubroshorea leprosula TaxID=152421 RepID=A0AAV5LGS7_9ROSI|nr:hypothetical protein SLEP1_g44488 [Rubroshorea leprosula]